MASQFQTSSSNAARMQQFVDALNEVYMRKKGYGVYAFLTPMAVMRLFNQFIVLKISEKEFTRTHIKLL